MNTRYCISEDGSKLEWTGGRMYTNFVEFLQIDLNNMKECDKIKMLKLANNLIATTEELAIVKMRADYFEAQCINLKEEAKD